MKLKPKKKNQYLPLSLLSEHSCCCLGRFRRWLVAREFLGNVIVVFVVVIFVIVILSRHKFETHCGKICGHCGSINVLWEAPVPPTPSYQEHTDAAISHRSHKPCRTQSISEKHSTKFENTKGQSKRRWQQRQQQQPSRTILPTLKINLLTFSTSSQSQKWKDF